MIARFSPTLLPELLDGPFINRRGETRSFRAGRKAARVVQWRSQPGLAGSVH
jgi:hypothetical protein